MKKITIALAVLLMTGTLANAQDLKKVRTAYNFTILPNAPAAKTEEAKTEIDKLATDPKFATNLEAVLLKAMIYGKIAGDKTLAEKFPNASTESLTAFKQYLELDKEAKKIKEESYVGLNEIYSSFFSNGVKNYNDKNWESAFKNFSQLVELSDMMISRKWTTATFDTTAYLYAGVTAQNAKNEEAAVKYYSALADLKITGTDYEGVYEYVTRYYLTGKNRAQFLKYLAVAREVYPKNELWNDLEFSFETGNSDLAELVKHYDEQDAAGKLTSMQYFDYGNFFINDKQVKDLEEAKRSQFTKKSAYSFGKAYQLDTTNLLAAYNAAVTTFALWEVEADAARQIKGTTPEIKAKRAQADKVADAAADKAVETLEKAYTVLLAKKERSNLERSSLNKSVDLLYNVYNYKRDRARGVNVKDYDKYDAKMKQFDALHAKY